MSNNTPLPEPLPLPTLTKAAGGCYMGKYDLHQLTSVEFQRALDAHAAAVSAERDAEIAQLRADNTRLQNEVVMPLRENWMGAANTCSLLHKRIKVLEDALQDLLVYDSVQTDYDGTVLHICPDCGGQEGTHSTNCAFVAARAALGDKTPNVRANRANDGATGV